MRCPFVEFRGQRRAIVSNARVQRCKSVLILLQFSAAKVVDRAGFPATATEGLGSARPQPFAFLVLAVQYEAAQVIERATRAVVAPRICVARFGISATHHRHRLHR
jgi:hypothetical protein